MLKVLLTNKKMIPLKPCLVAGSNTFWKKSITFYIIYNNVRQVIILILLFFCGLRKIVSSTSSLYLVILLLHPHEMSNERSAEEMPISRFPYYREKPNLT